MNKKILRLLFGIFVVVIIVTQGSARAENQLLSLTHDGQEIALDYLEWLKPLSKKERQQLRQNIKTLDKKVSENRFGGQRRKLRGPDNQWMQLKWIAEGRAIYNGLPGIPLSWREQFISTEKGAQSSQIGYWSSFAVLNARSIQDIPEKNSIYVVEGKISSISKNRGWIYLNFGSNWKTDFTAAIPPKSKGIFKSKGWKFDELENISVRVRGYLRRYNGPFMELYYPEQIETVRLSHSKLSNEK